MLGIREKGEGRREKIEGMLENGYRKTREV